jgi:erythromycin esterase-like protein
MVRRHARPGESAATPELIEELRDTVRPLRTPAELKPLFQRIGNARVVLLGEASHGTSEFYTWRAEITKRLVTEHGFNFVAVEGDWPDCYRVNRFVRGYPGAPDDARAALDGFRRWPTWMWANEEVCDLIAWLRKYNDGVPDERRVGFYGLDVYSLWASLREVMHYLRTRHPEALDAGHRTVRCFEPYAEEARDYARATALMSESCRDEVVNLLSTVRASATPQERDGRDGYFGAEQNALVVRNAEAYYRAMMRSDSGSWNVRDRHMAETLDRLLAHHGPAGRAVVWEHNTHVGDARYTDMADDGMVNLGQLARDRYGEGTAVLVGFGTHRGTVVAGEAWGEPWRVMSVPEARPDSWEDVLHRAGAEDQLLVFGHPSSYAMAAWRGHRAIGVVYRPRNEHLGNYVPTVLPERYDAFLYIDQTRAVRPLFAPERDLYEEEVPETFPTGQ